MKMVEILDKKPVPIWSLEIECTASGNAGYKSPCGSPLRVEESDLRFYDGTSGYFERSDAVVVKCPNCGALTDLKRNDWPREARKLAAFRTAWRNAV